ncbi:MAG: tRNA (adenosine(37)-N6)-threonylcarbamoyltransferase complex dimerization subunit type 1 TsaB [Parachlamydiales bacterium]|jgi:tRNA threonylcarbamoyl adenosine modification protein YeaZ
MVVDTTLLIDTCTETGFTAVFSGGVLKFQSFLGSSFDSAQALIPTLHAALQKNSLSLNEVDLIGVTAGPGSYTGMRLGIISAKCLAYALKKPLVGVPSVEAYAPLGMTEGKFSVLLDARMGGVYGAIGSIQQGRIEYAPPFLLPLDKVAEKLEGIHVVVSPHANRLQDKTAFLRGKDWHEALPSPVLMAEAVKKRWLKGEYSLNAEVEILYLRRTQAEIEREK